MIHIIEDPVLYSTQEVCFHVVIGAGRPDPKGLCEQLREHEVTMPTLNNLVLVFIGNCSKIAKIKLTIIYLVICIHPRPG